MQKILCHKINYSIYQEVKFLSYNLDSNNVNCNLMLMFLLVKSVLNKGCDCLFYSIV